LRARPGVAVLAVTALVATTAACSGGTGARRESLRVFAAASLTEAFTALGTIFERRHPGVNVVPNLNFAASSALARQINDGAPADVFASADPANMRKVRDAGNARAIAPFARNRLSLLVARGNPKHITRLDDLAGAGVTFAACAPEVPCGALAATALARAAVTATATSHEANVKAVVARVVLGEVDAGIVYVTDVRAAGSRAEGVPIDIAEARDLETVYEIALVTRTTNRAAARAWVDLVTSAEGRRTLARFGFRAP
jgi:molybdate transport system substrate-binding protein